MSNNIYSDQVNNSNLYANKLFYGEEGEQVENLGDQVAEKEDDKSEEDLLRDCRDETKKAKDKLIQCKKDAVESQREITKLEAEASELKSQVQEEREKVEQTKNEAEAKVDKLKLQVQEEREKVEQTKNEAKAEVDKLKLQFQEEREKVEQTKNEAEATKNELIQCKKNAEKMKENGGQAINQEKCDDIKAEAEQAKLEAKLAKEEILRYKIEQEKEEVMQSKIEEVKEELLKCKINMAKAETEWYKKAAEECKNEKRIGKDKPSIRGEDENDRGKHVTNEDDRTDKDKPSIRGEDENDRGKHVTNEGGNESGEITSREITPDLSLPEICGPKATLYKSNNKIGCQGFNTSDLLKELYPEMYSNSKIVPYIEKGSEGVYGAVNFKFAFTDNISSAANFSNTKCLKCIDSPLELACQDEKVKSFCQFGTDYDNKELNKNFFSRESCPDLIKDPGGANIVKAKQVAPLIIVNNAGNMIDKEGNNTQVHYNSLKPYLKLNGKIRDCGNDQKCKDYNAIMEKVAWDSDKEVLLKTAVNNTQEANPYYYENEDNSTFVEFGSI
ncbi:jg17560 [Pararge aegeria aegeria]|uniref:Jg17560 protein n=1 Tax=Pararge aegeria aegeria TaxID=348720 RepID=A0A8S4QMG8_9NEOP|nr:jg17560 [Pararge aegeria aegeria]